MNKLPMDKILKDLFQDGNNDGDITLKCSDTQNVKCHSLVVKSQSEYFKSMFHFQPEKKEVEVLYSSRVVKLLVNKMYNSTYPLVSSGDLEIDDIIDLTKMVDEFLIIDRDSIIRDLIVLFKSTLTKENWLDILNKIYGVDSYKYLIPECLLYFRDDILAGDEFVNNDPLKVVDLNSDLGRCLYKIVLQKVAYLNKKLGYNTPYRSHHSSQGRRNPGRRYTTRRPASNNIILGPWPGVVHGPMAGGN